MRQQGHEWDAVWGSIKHMIAKSLIAIQPILQYYYRSATRPDDEGFSCFEVGYPTPYVELRLAPAKDHCKSIFCRSPGKVKL